MGYRLKLKCPTCWAETYVRVDQEDQEKTKIDEAHEGHKTRYPEHDRPEIERRDPL